jgi:hypothetical protein
MIVYLDLKHSDLAMITISNERGDTVFDKDGSLPRLGILGGDYTRLRIDNNTGQIIGWKTISKEEIDDQK